MEYIDSAEVSKHFIHLQEHSKGSILEYQKYIRVKENNLV
jgi:hypothetical protein